MQKMRHVYFSFHYERDIWRANQVRNSGVSLGPRSAGFSDRSLWEEAKTKGRAALEQMIEDGLHGTSATVVLIGRQTSQREWVDFEIERSIARGNAVVGVRIHHLKDGRGRRDGPGLVPPRLLAHEAPVYTWNRRASALGRWVDDAIAQQCPERNLPEATPWGWVAGGVTAVGLAMAVLVGGKR